jgi:hypothetical protein
VWHVSGVDLTDEAAESVEDAGVHILGKTVYTFWCIFLLLQSHVEALSIFDSSAN